MQGKSLATQSGSDSPYLLLRCEHRDNAQWDCHPRVKPITPPTKIEMVPQTVINKTPYRACCGLGQSQACGFCLLSFVYGTGTRWKTLNSSDVRLSQLGWWLLRLSRASDPSQILLPAIQRWDLSDHLREKQPDAMAAGAWLERNKCHLSHPFFSVKPWKKTEKCPVCRPTCQGLKWQECDANWCTLCTSTDYFHWLPLVLLAARSLFDRSSIWT